MSGQPGEDPHASESDEAMTRPLTIVAATMALLLATSCTAFGWSGGGSGSAYSRAAGLQPGATPVAAVTGPVIKISRFCGSKGDMSGGTSSQYIFAAIPLPPRNRGE